MPAVAVIARLTFREAARRKILLAAFVLGVLFLVVFGVGFNYIYQEITASTVGTSRGAGSPAPSTPIQTAAMAPA